MTKGKTFNVIIGLIICALVIGTKLGSAYAKVGDNPLYFQNLYTYQDDNYGVHIRTDCRPGYTQVTSKDVLYNGCYKTVTYHVSGYNGKHYYRIYEDEQNGLGVCIHTSYRAVSSEVIRRYHRGTVSRTSYNGSGTVEKYMRTAYSRQKTD